DDTSTVAAAFAIAADGTPRMAFGGVAAIPFRAFEAEVSPNPREALARTLKPISDHRGSAAYRLALAQNLLEKFRSPSSPRSPHPSASPRLEQALPAHESARAHVTGEALYTDDLLARFPNVL